MTSKFGRPLLFTVHLESGALFSGLPIDALMCDRYGEADLTSKIIGTELAQPYSCLEGDIQCVQYWYLKDYKVICKVGNQVLNGRYLFTIDYSGDGLADDPEQYKSHNIIVLSNGNMVALPNNMCLFEDGHFTGELKEFPKYKRNLNYYMPGT